MVRALSFAALVCALVAPVVASGSRSPSETKRKRTDGKSEKNGKAAAHPTKSYVTIALSHLATHEQFELRPDGDGHFSAKRLKGLRHFLRCHHTGREHPMSPRLAQLLYATAHHFGDREITVIAGYRAPKVARKKGNPKSPHKRGVACDFRIAGVPNAELRDYLRGAYQDVGVGFYPNSGFVHLDVGRKQSAFWIDYSGPGERAEYSRDPDGDLASGRVEEKVTERNAPSVATPDGEDDDALPYADDPGMADLVPTPSPAPGSR